MTTAELAHRMRIRQSSVTLLEQGEAKGAITLASLQKAARALDCEVIYAVVPRETLERRLLRRFEEIARRKIRHVSHTMALEGQGVSEDFEAEQLKELVDQMLLKPPRHLWS